AWYKITGQLPGEGEGFGWLNALHPDDRAEVEADFCKSSRMEAFYCIEYRLKVASGGYRWHMDIATPRFDDGGNLIGYVGNVIDIHDRRIAEKRTQLSNNRFSAAIEAVSGIMWFTDASGNVIDELPNWSLLTGQSFDEYQGKGWINAIHPDDREHCLKMWNAALEQKKPLEVENRVRLSNGQWRLFAVRAIPVADAEGNIHEWVGVNTDVTEKRAHVKRVEHMATHDALTGLPNRLLFEDRLDHLIRHRDARQHAIFFLDLDEFKSINDRLGHQVGDELLKQIAKRIVHVVREGDTVSRFGGDEFVVLIENLDSQADAILPAEKILAAVSAPIQLGQDSITLHASIGICIYPQDGDDAAKLMRQADIAMYEAKKFRGDSFRFYEHGLEKAAG
ncbi:MAG TPA: diguanylate cyclase, partial [Methylophilaceae bacterium]|nr:diguanylate cyclase [Methylophilaceae bacterium]